MDRFCRSEICLTGAFDYCVQIGLRISTGLLRIEPYEWDALVNG